MCIYPPLKIVPNWCIDFSWETMTFVANNKNKISQVSSFNIFLNINPSWGNSHKRKTLQMLKSCNYEFSSTKWCNRNIHTLFQPELNVCPCSCLAGVGSVIGVSPVTRCSWLEVEEKLWETLDSLWAQAHTDTHTSLRLSLAVACTYRTLSSSFSNT